MGVTRTTDHWSIKEPIAGPWDWRSLLPDCECELKDLQVRASMAAPIGINLTRFFRWLESEITGHPVPGAPKSSKPLANYRRFLYELNVDHKPVHQDDEPAELLQRTCAFGGVTADAENARFAVAGSVNLAAA